MLGVENRKPMMQTINAISESLNFLLLFNAQNPIREHNTPLRGQNTWAKMRAQRDSPCVFVPANAVSDYSGLLATPCPMCDLKRTAAPRKNHATALCIGSLTNALNQLAKKTFGATPQTNSY